MADQSNIPATDGEPGTVETQSRTQHPGFEQMQQLSVYIKETDHVERKPLYLKILELVKSENGAGASVLKGVAGYSASSRSIRTAGFADVHQQLPMLIVIVDTASKIESLLPQLENWVSVNGGLITIQDLEGHCYLHPSLPRGGRR